MKKHPVLETLSFLSGPFFFPQMLIVGVFLVLSGALVWIVFFPDANSQSRHSNASYEGLDAESGDYWLLRAERDIDAARNTQGTPEQQSGQLRVNLSSTIGEAMAVPEPTKRNLALVSIIQAQLSRNVASNLHEAFGAMEKTPETRRQRANILPELAWFHIREKDRTRAMQMVREYIENLQAYQFDPNDPGERGACEEILNACIVLDLRSQIDALFLHLQYAAQTARNEERRAGLLEFLAVQQLRQFDDDAVFETVANLASAEKLAEIFRKMIEIRSGVFVSETNGASADGNRDTTHKAIRHPLLLAETLERIYDQLGTNQSAETQKDVLRRIFESEMTTHRELRALLRETLLASSSVDSSVKTFAVDILDNPRSETLKRALGTSPDPEESGTERTADANRARRETELDDHPPMSREKMLHEEIRVLVNTSQELLKWGRTREAQPLLKLAATRNQSLDFDLGRPNSSLTIAGIMIAAGDVRSAKTILADVRELLTWVDTGGKGDVYLAQVAQIQLRARLLEEARQTALKMTPGIGRAELLRHIALEQFHIGRFDDALKTLDDLPEEKEREHLAQSVRQTQIRFQRQETEGIYENPSLEHIRRDDSSGETQKQERFQALAETQIENRAPADARETVRMITDPKIRDALLVGIVDQIIDLARPYRSGKPLHREVRNNLFHLAFAAAKEISDVRMALSCMERLYTRISGFLSDETMERSLLDILTLLDETPGEPELKSDVLLRVVQARMQNEAPETRSLVSGTWCVFPDAASGHVPDPEAETNVRRSDSVRELYEKRENNLSVHSALLLKIGIWAELSESPEKRFQLFSSLASLCYQLHDGESGRIFFESALRQRDAVADLRIVSVTLLALAQSAALAGEEDDAKAVFRLAVDAADRISSSGVADDPSSVLDRRARERILTEIARGQAELDWIGDAVATTRLVEEPLFLDRLFKTIGYLLIARKRHDEAEEMFLRIANPRWKTLCLKDWNFHRRFERIREDRTNEPDGVPDTP